jgi:hypothetical protein
MSKLTTQPTVITTAAVNPFTRRTFMKTSALTVGAVTLLSKGTALAEAGAGSSSGTVKYWLKCTRDPLFGRADGVDLRKALDPVFPVFSSPATTNLNLPWIVGGVGAGRTWLAMTMSAIGPKMGDEKQSMAVTLEIEGEMVIDGKKLLGVTTYTKDQIADRTTWPGNKFKAIPDNRMLFLKKTVVIVSCDSKSGKISMSPLSGIESDKAEGGQGLGMSRATIANLAAFKASAKLEHNFRSVFTTDGELTAGFKEYIGVTVSGKYDVNNLGSFTVTPSALKWDIVKVKETILNNVTTLETIPLDVNPAVNDDERELRAPE